MEQAFANTLLLFISASVGVCGIAAVDLMLSKQGSKSPSLYRKYKNGYYELKPNITTYDSYGSFKTRIRTDSHSNRINEAASERQADSTSPLVDAYLLGDSFTFGVALPWEETIAGQLEKKV